MNPRAVRTTLLTLANPRIAEHSQRFFKTGVGEYAEGDQFLGIRVPVIRQQVNLCRDMPLADLVEVLHSPYHEERLLALLAMVDHFRRGDRATAREIYKCYLANTSHINNWDLVDSSAHQIVGAWLSDKKRQPAFKLARSKNLWERRIAMVASYHWIKRGDLDDAMALAEQLLEDKQDLIHKASGWMLREVGKKDEAALLGFLKLNYRAMPRTMLRYAIEKLPEKQRQAYLKGRV